MQIHMSPRHLTLTAAIYSFVAEKVLHLESMSGEILAAHVVLIHDGPKSDKTYSVKVHLAVPGPDLHAEECDGDLYAAIDKVVDKLARLLRKRKTRLNEKSRHTAQKTAEKRKSRV